MKKVLLALACSTLLFACEKEEKPNNLVEAQVEFDFTTDEPVGFFVVEHSSDGLTFTPALTAAAIAGKASYTLNVQVEKTPDIYFRMLALEEDGGKSYSNIVYFKNR